MNKFLSAVLITASLNLPAFAHVDAILSMNPDGSIPGIPAQFGKVTLKFKDWGTPNAIVWVTIGSRKTTLPSCMANLIKTRDPKDLQVLASWHHIETDSLPYYLAIAFPNPDHTTGRQFMFSLRDGKVLYISKYTDEPSMRRLSIPKIPADCRPQYSAGLT